MADAHTNANTTANAQAAANSEASAANRAAGSAAASSGAEPIIEAQGLEKFYAQPDGGRIQVVAPTDLTIYPGQILALLGPSGCGKSTLLRMLTGLAAPSAGRVLWHGQALPRPGSSPGTGGAQVPRVSIVFQSFALFPWLTVLENVEAPLEARGAPARERRERAMRILDAVGLDGFENAYPKELSGGMKQRVGFARALVVEPEVLFMDEPFSALDVLTAETLRNELLELWLGRKIPTRAIFLVTHNIEEAVVLADRVIVLAHNPARIRADFPVELAQPRDRKSERFTALVDHIYQVLTQPEAEFVPPATAGPAPAKYPMLPHARPLGIAGLAEILQDRNGRDDLHRLAGALVLEVDDLLPIVEAGALLEFLRVRQGDVELTEAGRAFAAADIQARKAMFRAAALAHVPLLRQIDSALAAKADHALPDEFFHDVLEEHFSADETQRQLETAIHWGRYAELFDYDAETHRLCRADAEPAAPPVL